MKKILLLAIATVFVFSANAQQVISGKSKPVYVNVGYDEAPPIVAKETKPVLTWLNPTDPETVITVRKGSIKVGINSEVKLRNVTLYINGIPSVGDRGLGVVSSEDAQQFDTVLEKELMLNEGENEVRVIAENINGEKTIESRHIKVELPIVASRNDYALLFATDDYDSWGDLTNPVNDARTIANELEEMYGFEVKLVENPTKKEVLSTLRTYAKKSYLEDDQLFIFFAGHGQFDPFFNQGYLVTKDSDRLDEEKLTYLSHSNLREIINNIPCKHIFLTIDACFGGTFDPVIARSSSRGADDMYNELTNTEYIKRKLRFKTRKYLTSGGKEYVPDGRPGRHSPFASKLLEALRTYGGRDKIITMPEIMVYVEKINPEPRTGPFGDNEPGSDFVFVAK